MVATLAFISASCTKNPFDPSANRCEIPDQKCDSAILVVGNHTDDTIRFNDGMGGSSKSDYTFIVAPGGSASFKTAGTEVEFASDCSIKHFAGSIQGIAVPYNRYFSVKMNRCNKYVYFIKYGNEIKLQDDEKD